MGKTSTMVVKLPEVFGAKAARKLGRELKGKMMKSANLHVVFDLTRVKKIDLHGLKALLSCMETIARQDGSLQFGGISPEAATMLELTRMDRLFQKFPGFGTDAPAFAFSPEPVTEEIESEPTVLPVAA